MKKVYGYVLLMAANVLSLSAAEMERPKPKKPASQPIAIQPSTIPKFIPAQQAYIEAEFPIIPTKQTYIKPDSEIWDVMNNDIKNTSHHPVQQTRTNATPVNLAPFTTTATHNTTIYKPLNEFTDQKEKDALLLTNSLQSHNEPMIKELSQVALSFIIEEITNDGSQSKKQKKQRKQLVCLIELMNNAKNNSLNEHLVGEFVHNNKEEYRVFDNSNWPFKKDISSVPSLLFSLLEKYRLTVSQTNEQLPLHFKAKKNSLKNLLNLETNINESDINSTANIPDVCSDLDIYPTFFKIIHALNYALERLPIESINSFTDYVYGKQSILLQDDSQSTYQDLKNEFYAKAYNLLLWKGSMDDLYHLIQMINNAKNKKDITDEADLGTKILEFEPETSMTSIGAKLTSFSDPAHSIENVKNYIFLFLSFIENYNNVRLTKITPTAAQYRVYSVKKALGLALPSDVNEHNPFNEKWYAFTEFKKLWKLTTALMDTNEEKVKQYLDQAIAQRIAQRKSTIDNSTKK